MFLCIKIIARRLILYLLLKKDISETSAVATKSVFT